MLRESMHGLSQKGFDLDISPYFSLRVFPKTFISHRGQCWDGHTF